MKNIFILTIVVLMTGATAALGSHSASQINQQKQKLNSINSQKHDAQRKIDEAKRKQAAITDQIEDSDKKLSQIQSQIETIRSELQAVSSKRMQTEKELDIVQAELEDTVLELNKAVKRVKFNKKVLNNRIANTYKNGKVSYIEVLLNARSFTDLVNRASFLQFIIEQDNQLLKRMKRAKQAVEEQKKQIELKKQKVQNIKVDLVAQEQRVAAVKKAQEDKKREEFSEKLYKQKLFDDAEKDKQKYIQLEEKLQQESQDIESMLKRMQGSSSSSPVMGTGKFIQPASGRLSSNFGYRIHPVYKYRKFHSGVDIAAPGGTPIYAADNGRVIFSGRKGGYGNTVIVDHGGGLTTLYAHCSALYASVGKKVSKGTHIAAVGSTGLSTGNHLHFEVRVNGSPVNPLNYL